MNAFVKRHTARIERRPEPREIERELAEHGYAPDGTPPPGDAGPTLAELAVRDAIYDFGWEPRVVNGVTVRRTA